MEEENVVILEPSASGTETGKDGETAERGPVGAVCEEENAPKSGEKEPFLGKFKSVDALMRAYEKLEAEFTRRSQRLRALEGREKAAVAENNAAAQPAPPQEQAQELSPGKSGETDEKDGETLYRAVMENQSVRARVLSDYLGSLKGVPLLAGTGSVVTAPKYRPQSIAEAGNLALGYFRSEKN